MQHHRKLKLAFERQLWLHGVIVNVASFIFSSNHRVWVRLWLRPMFIRHHFCDQNFFEQNTTEPNQAEPNQFSDIGWSIADFRSELLLIP